MIKLIPYNAFYEGWIAGVFGVPVPDLDGRSPIERETIELGRSTAEESTDPILALIDEIRLGHIRVEVMGPVIASGGYEVMRRGPSGLTVGPKR